MPYYHVKNARVFVSGDEVFIYTDEELNMSRLQKIFVAVGTYLGKLVK